MPDRLLRPIHSVEEDILHLRKILENRKNAEALRTMDMLGLTSERIEADRRARHAIARQLRNEVED